jgi:DNA helicase-2/ATP-dependent DNA helicase PcrA
MLLKAVELLNTDPWVADHHRRQYRYVLVDEGQEMNRAQYELLRALCADELFNVFVVADANQSINSYAGGGPQFLAEFERDFSARRYWLTTNFRSARRIVEAVAALGHHIQSRHVESREMSAATLAAGCVTAVSYDDEPTEAGSVVDWIEKLLADGLDRDWIHEDEDRVLAPEDICIQGRTRYAFDHVVGALGQQGIPFVVRTAEGGLFDSVLGKLTFYGLRLVENPRDLPSRRRFLAELDTSSPSQIGSSGDEVAETFRGLGNEGVVPELWAALLADVAAGSRPESGVIDALLGIQLDPEHPQATAWELDQQELRRCWTDYQAATRFPERSLSGLLKYLTQLQRTVRDEPGVRILTPHRARGLGFRAVVVLGMNEGTFPYYLARSATEVDEERRAVYVAASRASRALLLSRPRVRFNQYGRRFDEQESRFIGEMSLTMENR